MLVTVKSSSTLNQTRKQLLLEISLQGKKVHKGKVILEDIREMLRVDDMGFN